MHRAGQCSHQTPVLSACHINLLSLCGAERLSSERQRVRAWRQSGSGPETGPWAQGPDLLLRKALDCSQLQPQSVGGVKGSAQPQACGGKQKGVGKYQDPWNHLQLLENIVFCERITQGHPWRLNPRDGAPISVSVPEKQGISLGVRGTSMVPSLGVDQNIPPRLNSASAPERSPRPPCADPSVQCPWCLSALAVLGVVDSGLQWDPAPSRQSRGCHGARTGAGESFSPTAVTGLLLQEGELCSEGTLAEP